MSEQKMLEMGVNEKLVELLAPQGLKIGKDTIETGEKISRIYYISSYPDQPALGWIDTISNIPNTIVNVYINPVDPQDFLNGLKKGTNSDLNIMNTTRDEVERIRAEARYNSSIQIIKDIEDNSNMYVYISILVQVNGIDKPDLLENCKMFLNKVSGMGMRARVCSFIMDKAYRQIAPFGIVDKEIFNISKQNLQIGTLFSGQPFEDSGFIDKTGFFLGNDSFGRMITLDPFHKENDRTNSNFAVVGQSGGGKSYAVKKIILNTYISGTRIGIIDPENEYKDMCKKIEGSKWIDCSGGLGENAGRINPLQVYNLAKIDLEDEDEIINEYSSIKSPLAQHFQNLGTFFSLYFKNEMSVRLTAILNETLEELYKKFNITWETDTSKLKATDFPIMKDLYDLLILKYEKETEKSKKDNYEELSAIIRELAIGSDSAIFNGHTTIKADSKFIVLDTSNMAESKENVKSCQYYNMLRFLQNIAFEDRNEKFMVVADESYLLLDPRVPQGTEFLRNFSKRARKYNCSLVVITQSIVDFLADSIKQYGQALFDNSTYKLFFGMDGQNLIQAKEIWNLTTQETNMLANKQKGQCLLFIGARRMLCRIRGQHFEQPFLTGGGR